MEIILNEKNLPKIEAELNKVQKNARERTITVQTICDYARLIEEKLGISKKALGSSWFSVDPHARDYPNAYKFTPQSTQFVLRFFNGTWRVKEIRREATATNGYGKQVRSVLSASAKEALLKKYQILSIWA